VATAETQYNANANAATATDAALYAIAEETKKNAANATGVLESKFMASAEKHAEPSSGQDPEPDPGSGSGSGSESDDCGPASDLILVTLTLTTHDVSEARAFDEARELGVLFMSDIALEDDDDQQYDITAPLNATRCGTITSEITAPQILGAPASPPSGRDEGQGTVAAVGGGVGAALGLLCCVALVGAAYRRKKKEEEEETQDGRAGYAKLSVTLPKAESTSSRSNTAKRPPPAAAQPSVDAAALFRTSDVRPIRFTRL
jgi:hypothetical protein